MRKRRYHIISVVFFISLLWAGSVYAADVAKIGVVDLQRLMETSDPGKSAQAKIKKQKDKMELELKQKGAEIEELRKQLERKVPMPPPSGTFFMPPAWTIQPAGVEFDPPGQHRPGRPPRPRRHRLLGP